MEDTSPRVNREDMNGGFPSPTLGSPGRVDEFRSSTQIDPYDGGGVSQRKIVTRTTEIDVCDIDYKNDIRLPHDITINVVQNVGDLKNTWRGGMKKIENEFMALIRKLEAEFDQKTAELERLRKQLMENFEFLKQYERDMMSRLN